MKKLFLLILIICFMTCIAFASDNKSERFEVEYVKTSDGDTARFIVDGENIRVRFLGINTPEVSGEDKVEEPYGNEALEYTRAKLDSAKKIEIEYDKVADSEDRFGRKLAWIWVDDELYELELLEKGLAKTYMLKDDYNYATELKQAEKKAKESKVGLWSNDTERPSEPIQKPSGEINPPIDFEFFKDEENINEQNTFVPILICIIIVIIVTLIKIVKK